MRALIIAGLVLFVLFFLLYPKELTENEKFEAGMVYGEEPEGIPLWGKVLAVLACFGISFYVAGWHTLWIAPIAWAFGKGVNER